MGRKHGQWSFARPGGEQALGDRRHSSWVEDDLIGDWMLMVVCSGYPLRAAAPPAMPGVGTILPLQTL